MSRLVENEASATSYTTRWWVIEGIAYAYIILESRGSGQLYIRKISEPKEGFHYGPFPDLVTAEAVLTVLEDGG